MTITAKDLPGILERHTKWLRNEAGGELAALLRECADNCYMPDERRERVIAALAKVGP